MARLDRKEDVVRARKQATASLLAVERNEAEIKRLMRRRYKCTGYAFVTFNQYQVAQAVLQELPKRLTAIAGAEISRFEISRSKSLFGAQLGVCRPPEPEDVIWENLQCTARERLFRQAATCSIMLLLAIGGSWVIFAGLHSLAPGVTVDPINFFHFLGLYLASLALIIGGHVILFVTVPLLAFTVERPHSHGDREQSILLKLSFFQVLQIPPDPTRSH